MERLQDAQPAQQEIQGFDYFMAIADSLKIGSTLDSPV
jgi:hypothetical protein